MTTASIPSTNDATAKTGRRGGCLERANSRCWRASGHHDGKCLRGQDHQADASIGEIIFRLARGVRCSAMETQGGRILRPDALLHAEASPDHQLPRKKRHQLRPKSRKAWMGLQIQNNRDAILLEHAGASPTGASTNNMEESGHFGDFGERPRTRRRVKHKQRSPPLCEAERSKWGEIFNSRVPPKALRTTTPTQTPSMSWW